MSWQADSTLCPPCPSCLGPTLAGQVLRWFTENRRDFPWRHTCDPYRIAVAEVLLRQTHAEKVAPKYQQLLERYPDAHSLAVACVEEVEDIVRSLGFVYRAAQLIQLANAVTSAKPEGFPDERGALQCLPGIGQYTASAILCFAYQRPVAAVDVNVLRIYRRYFGLRQHSTKRGPTKALVQLATAMLPADELVPEFNLALLDLAALVCTHYAPRCAFCPLAAECDYSLTPTGTVKARSTEATMGGIMTFDNDDPAQRARLIDALGIIGLTASEHNSGGGITHVIVSLLDPFTQPPAVHAASADLEADLRSAVAAWPQEASLYIATNSLNTACDVGLFGSDGRTGTPVSSPEWHHADSLGDAVCLFHKFWKERDLWLAKYLQGQLGASVEGYNELAALP